MTPIVWSDAALADLRAIRLYIARDSDQYATRVLDRIRVSVERLESFPLIGEVVAEWKRQDVREVLAGNYRVIYRPTADQVVVLAVVHAARQLPPYQSLP